jgi:hypothetical protein
MDISLPLFCHSVQLIVRFDAIVTRQDGHRECRMVRPKATDASIPALAEQLKACRSAARHLGASYVEITATDLDQAEQRIRNWERLLAAYRRCAHRQLDVLEQLIFVHVTRAEEATFRDVMGWIPHESTALLAAAIARLLRRRKLASDLDVATWSMHTRLQVTP